MARDIYRNGYQFQAVHDLREAILTIWNNIVVSFLQMVKWIYDFMHSDGSAMPNLDILLGISCFVLDFFRYGLKCLISSYKA